MRRAIAEGIGWSGWYILSRQGVWRAKLHTRMPMHQFIMKKHIMLEGLGTHSPPCQISPCRLAMRGAILESNACFLSMESEHQEPMMVWELKETDSLDHEALLFGSSWMQSTSCFLWFGLHIGLSFQLPPDPILYYLALLILSVRLQGSLAGLGASSSLCANFVPLFSVSVYISV